MVGHARLGARLDRAGREAGQIMLLSVVFGVLALLLVTAVVSATSIHLERKALLILADDLALRAANGIDLDAFYRGHADAPTSGGVVPLTDAGVRRSVEGYVAADCAEELVARHHLRASREPNVVLRVVRRFTPDWPPAHEAPLPAIALDLLEDPDPRAREVGYALIALIARIGR